MVYIKYIEYRKVHVSKRKIPRNRKVSGVFLLGINGDQFNQFVHLK